MIKISNRLKVIGNMVLEIPSFNIMDVGCDHALLDIYLYQNNDKLNILATDVNKNPLKSAKNNIDKYGLTDKIIIKESKGIDLLDKNSTVVIAGMGKDTIIDILKENKDKLKLIDNLIVSSHSKIPELRKDINQLNFKIVKEKVVYDENKYYVVISYTKGKEKLTDRELLLGPILLNNKDKEVLEYYRYLLDKYTKINDKIPVEASNKEEMCKVITLIKKELNN